MQTDIIHRLSGGGQSGRASAAEKALEAIKAEANLVPKPFVPKKRSFAFPNPERMGQRVLEIVGLTHGYGDRQLFDDVSLEMEKRERVALIGEWHPPWNLLRSIHYATVYGNGISGILTKGWTEDGNGPESNPYLTYTSLFSLHLPLRSRMCFYCQETGKGNDKKVDGGALKMFTCNQRTQLACFANADGALHS